MTSEQKKAFIGFDTQGWPIFKLRWRDILEMLGGTYDEETCEYRLSETNCPLDDYPMCLEDDGMGYGVNGKFVTEVNNNGYMFIEPMQEGAEKGPSFVLELEYDLKKMHEEEENGKRED